MIFVSQRRLTRTCLFFTESLGDDIVNQGQQQDDIDENRFDINESWVDDIVKQAQQQVAAATSNSSTSNPATRKKIKRSSGTL